MVGKLFCCVDGGGTKTKVALYNEEDHLLGITNTGPTNLALYADDAWNIITKALYGLISNASMEASVISNVHFGIGIAGANNLDQRKNLIEKCLLDFKEVRVATDSYIAALGAHGGHPGGIVIVGTGSVGYRINNDSESKLVGGWGFPAGDHGSGAWIGKTAIIQTLRLIDGCYAGNKTKMHQAIITHYGPTRNDFMKWLFKANATSYSEIAPIVLEYANKQDEAALSIALAAGIEIETLALALDCSRKMPLSLIGGLATPLLPYLPVLLRDWVQDPIGDPISGALMLAKELVPNENIYIGAS